MASAVNEKHLPIGYQYGMAHMKCANSLSLPFCEPIPRASTRMNQATWDRIVVFHYTTRSLEDFELKQKRAGGQNKAGKPIEQFYFWAECAPTTGMLRSSARCAAASTYIAARIVHIHRAALLLRPEA